MTSEAKTKSYGLEDSVSGSKHEKRSESRVQSVIAAASGRTSDPLDTEALGSRIAARITFQANDDEENRRNAGKGGLCVRATRG